MNAAKQYQFCLVTTGIRNRQMEKDVKTKYQSGLCNIGEREVIIRQKMLLFAFFATGLFTILVHFFNASALYLILFFSAFVTILIVLEIKMQFCILFAFFGLHNFKTPGNLEDVPDKRCLHKDRRKAMLIILGSAVLAIPYTAIIWFLTHKV